MVRIREIQTKDNKTIERIIKQSLETEKLDIPGTAYFDPYLGELTEFYETIPNAAYWVAVNEKDQAVGGVGIGPFGKHDKVSELQKLYLAPEARGKGIAKKLMTHALNFAQKHYRSCYLETFASLHPANQLYESYGFRKLDSPLSGSEHNACDTWYMKHFS
jgi:putative acetyltransferase